MQRCTYLTRRATGKKSQSRTLYFGTYERELHLRSTHVGSNVGSRGTCFETQSCKDGLNMGAAHTFSTHVLLVAEIMEIVQPASPRRYTTRRDRHPNNTPSAALRASTSAIRTTWRSPHVFVTKYMWPLYDDAVKDHYMTP